MKFESFGPEMWASKSIMYAQRDTINFFRSYVGRKLRNGELILFCCVLFSYCSLTNSNAEFGHKNSKMDRKE